MIFNTLISRWAILCPSVSSLCCPRVWELWAPLNRRRDTPSQSQPSARRLRADHQQLQRLQICISSFSSVISAHLVILSAHYVCCVQGNKFAQNCCLIIICKSCGPNKLQLQKNRQSFIFKLRSSKILYKLFACSSCQSKRGWANPWREEKGE